VHMFINHQILHYKVRIGVLHVIVHGIMCVRVRVARGSKFVTASRASKFVLYSTALPPHILYQKLLRFSVALASSFLNTTKESPTFWSCGSALTVVRFDQCSGLRVGRGGASCPHVRECWTSISTTLSPSLSFQRMVRDR
jgi:hypothetical protein